MNLQNANNIYMVGIKGVGMTALALILKKMGKNVWGSDVSTEFKTDSVLHTHDIKILTGFKEHNISNSIELVITTAAHGGLANQEVIEAKKRGIPVVTHAEALGAVMNLFKTKIAICGTHGKTTTSAMAAFVFNSLKLKFGYQVGTPFFSGMVSGDFTGYDYFVTESDEFVASPGIDNTPRFMFQNPDIVICTSIDYDHPDVYKTPEAMYQAYENFFHKLDKNHGTLIYYADDPKLQEIVKKLTRTKLTPYKLRNDIELNLQIPGDHNRLNAEAVITLCDVLNLDQKAVVSAISQFSGSSRRFEKKYEFNDYLLYDDYAHHPTEITATIQAFRSQYPNKRLIVIFQPHTYSRTHALKDGFIDALSKADQVLITEIFGSAREQRTDFDITSEKIVTEAQEKGVTNIQFCPKDRIITQLPLIIKKGDIIVTMGAGSIYELNSGIIDVLKKL